MLRPAGTSRAPPCCRRRCAGHTDADLDRWAASGKTLIALIPGLDGYLRPDEGRRRFARASSAEVIAVEGAKHLWVGESYVRIVMNEIVRRMNPRALIPPAMTLPKSRQP
jgi:uncharacterized protein